MTNRPVLTLSRIALTAAIALMPFATASGDDEVVRLSEPVATTATHEVFGAPLDEEMDTVSLAALVANADANLDSDVAVRTRIAKVCQKKGCFFVATDGAVTARVTFKDYGFFIPTDAGGKTVDLVGTFDRRELSAERARHYARDLGEKAPENVAENAPAFEYVIVASAVRIPK